MIFWYLQIPASLRHNCIVLTSYLFSYLLIERDLRCSPGLLGKKPSTSAPPYYIPFSSTIFFSFFRGHCVGKWFLHGKGHRCHQEAHLLWEEEGPDINRKSCAAELLLPLREGGLENNVSSQFRTGQQETHAPWCLLCRGNDKHYLA